MRGARNSIRAVAVLCWLALASARPAQPAAADGAPGPTPAGPAADEGKDMYTVVLANGDQMRARLVGIVDGKLVVDPEVVSGARMQIPIARVGEVLRDGKVAAPKAGGADLLRLTDGSVLQGRFLALEGEWVRFDVEEVCPVKVPRSAAVELVREGRPPVLPAGGSEQFLLATKAGDVILGDVRQDADGTFVIAGGAVSARVAAGSVALLRFPPPKEPVEVKSPEPGADVAAGTPLLCGLALCAGSVLFGAEPGLADGRFSLTLAGGQRVTVPLAGIAEINFVPKGAVMLSRRMLVWGRFSERPDEYTKTMNIVKAQLGTTWQIAEDFGDIDAAFERELGRAGVLLIPEMESGTASGDHANRLGPPVERFLRRGGRIVVLGPTEKDMGFLKAAGIIDLRKTADGEGTAVPFTAAGRRIAKDVGDAFTSTNSTMFYEASADSKAEPFARNERGAPIVGRKAGIGWVIVMGMDYYAWNDQTVKLLVNAITFR